MAVQAMGKEDLENRRKIQPAMTVLEVIEAHPQTESVFRRYDRQAGVCLCCQALFESLEGISAKYGFELEVLLRDLHRIIESERNGSDASARNGE